MNDNINKLKEYYHEKSITELLTICKAEIIYRQSNENSQYSWFFNGLYQEEIRKIIDELEGEHEMNNNLTLNQTGYITNIGNGVCPNCGTELNHICLTANPPINKVECPKCGYTKDIRELTIDLDEIYNTVKSAIKIKKLRQDIQLPKYGSDLASGFDVRAYDCVMWDITKNDLVSVELSTNDKGEKGWFIDDNTTVIFKTGLAMACGEHEEVQARARSGFSLKTPMRISNGIGTIDEDFRGEVGIIMDNNGQYGRWFVPYVERVAQLVVCPVVRPSILEVDDLDDTQRGEGGYGSTGTK